MGSDHEIYMNYVPHPRPTEPVTIFYGSGTRAHKEDFQQLIEPALIAVAKRYSKRIAIVLVGWLPISDELREAAETSPFSNRSGTSMNTGLSWARPTSTSRF